MADTRKLTKAQTKRMLLAISGKISKLTDSYFLGTRHQSKPCIMALQASQREIMKQYDKVK